MAKEVKLKMTLDETGAVVGIEKVGQRFKRMGDSGRTAGGLGNAGFMKIAAGAASALGVLQLVQGAWRTMTGILGDSITKTAQTQDEIAKLSHKIGVSTETLSAYRLATQLSGTSMESLATGLRMTAKNAYDFSRGTGEAKDSLEELDITVLDNNGKLRDAEDIMLDVADKLMLVEDSSRRTAIAQKVFGRSGTELLPLLEGGRAGLEAMKAEAHELGITFTDETAAASEEYNDSIARMNFLLEGFKMKLGNAVIPALTNMLKAVMQNKNLLSSMAEVAVGAGNLLKSTIWLIAKAGETWANFSVRVYNTASLFKVFDKQFEDSASTSKAWANTFHSISEGIENLNLDLPPATRATMDFNDELDETGDAGNEAADGVNKAAEAIDAWTMAIIAANNHEWIDVKAQGPELPGLSNIFGNVDAAAEAAKRKQEEIERAASGFQQISLTSVSPGIQTSGSPYFGLTDETVQNTVTAFGLMKGAVTDFGQAGAQAFAMWATNQTSFGKGLKQSTAQVMAQIAQQALGYGMMHAVMAIAALTPWGAAIYGDPLVHAKSAAGFFAIAAGTGLAAKGLSSSAGGMGAAGTATNPIYTQPSGLSANQQIYSGQAEVFMEIRDALNSLQTQPAGIVVKTGVGQAGGVAVLMNDNDKNIVRNTTLRSRYA